MLKFGRIVLIVLTILASSSITPAAQALPRDYVEIYYYDCDWNQVGYWIRACNGYVYSGGTQTGAYREQWSEACSTGTGGTYTVLFNCGGTWVGYNGQVCGVC